MLTFGLQINEAEAAEQIVDFLVSKFSRIIRDMVGPVKEKVARQIDFLIRNSPEYESLLSDDTHSLHGQLGVVNPENFMNAMISTITDNVNVETIPFTRRGDSFDGGMLVQVLLADFSDVLSIAGASFPSKGGNVDWLRWLLLGGASELINTHFYLGGRNFTHWSRTGLGIMAKSYGKRSWGVPSEFAGDISDNWLTRALTPILDDIGIILKQELLSRS